MTRNLLSGKRYINIVLLIAATSFMFYANSTGKTGATQKNGDGCTCHGGQSSGVQVTINGPASLTAGATGDYSVTISGGPLTRGGTNIAVSAGTLEIITGEGTKLEGGEITHTSPKVPVSGTVTFNFRFTAPSTAGAVTMFANGNSVNLNGNNVGDQWNFAPNKTIDVVTGIEEGSELSDYALLQNYPNPFNPSTVISYSAKKPGMVNISLFDITGKEVAVLVNEYKDAGNYSISLNTTEYNLSSGVYLYRMQIEGFTAYRKLVLNK